MIRLYGSTKIGPAPLAPSIRCEVTHKDVFPSLDASNAIVNTTPMRSALRGWRGRERSTEGIADNPEDITVMYFDGFAHDGVVTLPGGFRRGGVLLRQFGAALDVGEEEGNGAGG